MHLTSLKIHSFITVRKLFNEKSIAKKRKFAIFDQFFLSHSHLGLEPRFGHALLPSDFYSDRIVPRSGVHHLPTGYRRPWALAREAANELVKDQKNLHFGKDGFQACVDVHHFKPSEISVKSVDHTVIIEGKHEERDDNHGSVSRHFVRK
jgi:Hsp20/alpha crystallin family